MDKTKLPKWVQWFFIPVGYYCYRILDINILTGKIMIRDCPFRSIDSSKPKQENGYCSYLGYGDEDSRAGLLWDGVKECGRKMW